MENALKGEDLLPDPSSLEPCRVNKEDHSWTVNAVASPAEATCPECGVPSTARHSRYLRHLKDLPVQGCPVKLTVRVTRWRCRNPSCERRIFCQRLKEVAHKHARETKRFGEILQLLGHAMGGRPGERLSARLGLLVSNDALLRRVKRWAMSRPPLQPIAALGVDDWAWRKGYGRYGAILVDLQRRKVAELLPECSRVAVEQWLRQHPGVKVISRDRQGSLAEGGRRGAPGRPTSGGSLPPNSEPAAGRANGVGLPACASDDSGRRVYAADRDGKSAGIEEGLGGGGKRGETCLEQRTGGRPYQPFEDSEEADVWTGENSSY